MTAIRVAIVGVGNCASSLVQGVQYYKDADPESQVPGLMHVQFGPYHVRDVEFVAAFDVDAKKVGFDLAEAINASENNTIKIADVPPTNVTVQRGPTLDGIGKYYADTIELSDVEPVDVVQVLKEAKVDVLVSYLPVGSEEADKFYAQCAIDAGVAFVNALPVFIASDPVWAKKFADAGVPQERWNRMERMFSTFVVGFVVSEVSGRFPRDVDAFLSREFAADVADLLGLVRVAAVSTEP